MTAGAAASVDFHVVIPSFRECGRLPAYLADLVPLLARQVYRTRVLVVDDGSGGEEQRRVDAIVAAAAMPSATAVTVAVSHLERNRGKGYAVRYGWKAGTDARWLAFADADGATPAREVVRVLEGIYRANDPRRSYLGSRIRMLGRTVDRRWRRHLMGRMYATLVGVVIDEGVYDSQCGFKVIPSAVFASIADLLQEDRFAFDGELLAALLEGGHPVEEVPIDWIDIPGSKVSLVRDSFRMVKSLFLIGSRKKAGAYRRVEPR